MHLAIQSPSSQRPTQLVKRLMLKGADLGIKDNKGRTATELCTKNIAKT